MTRSEPMWKITSQYDARHAGMIPLTLPMPADSPELAQVIADMRSVAGTQWACIDSGGGYVEVWRKPSSNFLSGAARSEMTRVVRMRREA